MTPDLPLCKRTWVRACVRTAGPVHGVPFGGVSWPEDQFPMGRSGELPPGYLNLGSSSLFQSWECLHGHSCCGRSAQWRDFGAAEVGMASPAIALCPQCCLGVVGRGWGAPSPRFCTSEPDGGDLSRPELPGAGE